MRNKSVSERGTSPLSFPIFFAGLLFALVPAGACMANPITINPVSVTAEGAVLGMGIDVVADGAVLVLAYLLLKRGRDTLRWAFARHWGVVFVAGLVIDLFMYMATGGTIMSGPGVVTYVVLGILSLGTANFIICRRNDNFMPKEAMVVGALIGVLTNPALYEVVLRAAGFQINLVPKSSGGF